MTTMHTWQRIKPPSLLPNHHLIFVLTAADRTCDRYRCSCSSAIAIAVGCVNVNVTVRFVSRGINSLEC
ncbi:MAG: hypothetical protein GPI92_23545 [Microcystis aeruginosa K13-06]|nr:hypothetical protein [Microcystis aeruginosa K13-06]